MQKVRSEKGKLVEWSRQGGGGGSLFVRCSCRTPFLLRVPSFFHKTKTKQTQQTRHILHTLKKIPKPPPPRLLSLFMCFFIYHFCVHDFFSYTVAAPLCIECTPPPTPPTRICTLFLQPPPHPTLPYYTTSDTTRAPVPKGVSARPTVCPSTTVHSHPLRCLTAHRGRASFNSPPCPHYPTPLPSYAAHTPSHML